MLYVPASNPRAMEKARTLPADGFIVDLEDAVLPDAKEEARATAAALVREGGFGRRDLLIRINALETPWGRDDIRMLAGAGPVAVLLPKAVTVMQVRAAAELLSSVSAASRLWVMMETAGAILSAREIAAVGAPLAGFVIGTGDLSTELNCAHPTDRAPMLMALQTCVMAARAYDLAVLDGAHIDLNDEAGFLDSCRQGRALGFDGRTLIHPRQIAGANEVYAPSDEELAQARRIVEAHQAAVAQGRGVTLVDGRLIEALNVRAAERLMAQSALIAALASA